MAFGKGNEAGLLNPATLPMKKSSRKVSLASATAEAVRANCLPSAGQLFRDRARVAVVGSVVLSTDHLLTRQALLFSFEGSCLAGELVN